MYQGTTICDFFYVDNFSIILSLRYKEKCCLYPKKFGKLFSKGNNMLIFLRDNCVPAAENENGGKTCRSKWEREQSVHESAREVEMKRFL